jgi:hypothetical protein
MAVNIIPMTPKPLTIQGYASNKIGLASLIKSSFLPTIANIRFSPKAMLTAAQLPGKTNQTYYC